MSESWKLCKWLNKEQTTHVVWTCAMNAWNSDSKATTGTFQEGENMKTEKKLARRQRQNKRKELGRWYVERLGKDGEPA